MNFQPFTLVGLDAVVSYVPPAMAAVAVRILDRAPITKQCNEIDFVIKPFTLYTYHVSCVAYVEVEQGGPFDGGVIAPTSWWRKSNRSVERGRRTRHQHFHGHVYFGQYIWKHVFWSVEPFSWIHVFWSIEKAVSLDNHELTGLFRRTVHNLL